MLLVVLGHTMTGCTTGAEESFLYNIVFSLQMPLFILISGYVTKYSRSIKDASGLWKYVKKRTVAYMLPWLIWSLLVRGVILGQHNFLNIKYLLWHMDTGYWFLATIWTISMIFGLSTYFAGKISKGKEIKNKILTLLFYVVGMAVLAAVGFVFGFSFFAIKLTLYYMPFYFAGYLYGQYRERILNTKWGKQTVDAAVAACFAVWLAIMTRCYIYALSDSVMAVALRIISSMTGCIAVCGLCKGLFSNAPPKKSVGRVLLRWCGVHSQEIYLAHYLLLNLLKLDNVPLMGSITGAGLILLNYTVTVLMTGLTIRIVGTSRILRMTLFGNKK